MGLADLVQNPSAATQRSRTGRRPPTGAGTSPSGSTPNFLVNDTGHGAWRPPTVGRDDSSDEEIDKLLPSQMRTALSGLMAASKDGPLSTTCLSPERAIVDDHEEEPSGPVR